MELVSWLFVLVGLVGVWVSGLHYSGWLITGVFQAFWVWYAITISASALAFQSALFGLIACRNYFVGRGPSF